MKELNNTDRLPQPLVCECGFSTMSAKEAIRHADKHWLEEHPEHGALDELAQGKKEEKGHE